MSNSLTKNSVGDAKLNTDKDFCTLDDLEVCERGVDKISTVDEFGMGEPHIEKEIYMGEAYICYYYCTKCTESWSYTEYNNDPAKAWEKAKGHLNAHTR